jgi:hypothetical protein
MHRRTASRFPKVQLDSEGRHSQWEIAVDLGRRSRCSSMQQWPHNVKDNRANGWVALVTFNETRQGLVAPVHPHVMPPPRSRRHFKFTRDIQPKGINVSDSPTKVKASSPIQTNRCFAASSRKFDVRQHRVSGRAMDRQTRINSVNTNALSLPWVTSQKQKLRQGPLPRNQRCTARQHVTRAARNRGSSAANRRSSFSAALESQVECRTSCSQISDRQNQIMRPRCSNLRGITFRITGRKVGLHS